MNQRNANDRGPQFRDQSYGSSSTAVTVAVIVLVGALLVAAGFVLLRGRGGDGGDEAASAQPTATSTSPSLISTATVTASEEPPTATSTAPATNTPESPTATTPPTEEEVATEDETEPEVTETEAEPTATTESQDTPEPTSEIEEPGTPTEAPATGDFGQLPPAQLPSGGSSSVLSLDYQLAMSLEDIPASGTVFQIGWPVLSADEAQAFADSAGIDAEVVEEGPGIFRAEGSTGSLYITPNQTVFQSYVTPEGSMPGESEALSIALNWLQSSGLVGSNNDGGIVTIVDESAGHVVTFFQPANPAPILSPIPGASVTVGLGGEVVEAQIRWQDSYETSDYGFSSALSLWSLVESGQGYLEADLSGLDTSGGLTGTATITGYSTAFTIAGNPSIGYYLTPVVVFEGTARIDQTGEEIPVSVSVSAVYDQIGSSG